MKASINSSDSIDLSLVLMKFESVDEPDTID